MEKLTLLIKLAEASLTAKLFGEYFSPMVQEINKIISDDKREIDNLKKRILELEKKNEK